MKVKVKVEVNMFLCLTVHRHINIRSYKCIIVVSFAAYYMKKKVIKRLKYTVTIL